MQQLRLVSDRAAFFIRQIARQTDTAESLGGEAGESQEVANLKSRLIDIDRILERCGEAISTLATRTKTLTLES
jgi:hypothetical protein